MSLITTQFWIKKKKNYYVTKKWPSQIFKPYLRVRKWIKFLLNIKFYKIVNPHTENSSSLLCEFAISNEHHYDLRLNGRFSFRNSFPWDNTEYILHNFSTFAKILNILSRNLKFYLGIFRIFKYRNVMKLL